MNSKKWIKKFILLSILVFLFVGTFNYFIDPYGFNNLIKIEGINKKKYSNTRMTTRFKANILENGNFDTIMLGTSRIGVMNPDILNNYLNSKTFNLELPVSNTIIQNKFFKYAHNFNDIKYLIYGIDFLSFNKNRIIKNDFEEFFDLEKDIENFEKILNFDLYFNIDTLKKSVNLILKNILNKQKNVVTYLSTNGMRDYQDNVEKLENGDFKLNESIKDSIRMYFKINTGYYKNYEFSYKYLEYFQNIIDYCKLNNITIFVFIPPMSSTHFDAINSAGYFDEFELFKKELVKITNYIDFTGHNTITKNKNNYWDSSHLRKDMTQVVMAKIFNDKSLKTPNDFGVLVTKDNINEHLENLRSQINYYDLSKILK